MLNKVTPLQRSGSGAAGPLPDSSFLADWVFFHAERAPEAPAIADARHRLTYGQLAERVGELAGDFDGHGVGTQDRVLLAVPNSPATVVAGLALNALGATSVEVNREWSHEVLREIVDTSGVTHVVIAACDISKWGAALAGLGIRHAWVIDRRPFSDFAGERLAGIPSSLIREDGRAVPGASGRTFQRPAQLAPQDSALILYTSGSTGRPRGVIQTFANINANTRSIVEYLGLTAADRALLMLPLYYCYGRSVLQTHLLVGGSLYLEKRMAFPRLVLETLASEKCTGLAGVPLTFEIFRRQVNVSTVHMPSLRYLTQAGGAMAPATTAWVRDSFRPARLFVMYGQTEATARLAYLPPERAEEKVGSMGIAIPGVELRVVDDHGRELPTGEVGQLIARGANVTLGYLDDPEGTAAILRDGWLWTGDLAERDADGFFYHRGRVREVLKVGGRRVSPIEIEQVIERHPGIAEAAVIGVRDALKGEVPLAVVVPRPGVALREAEILLFCSERLPPYLLPVAAKFTKALPRNPAGKLLRAEVLETYGAHSGGPPDSGTVRKGPSLESYTK